MEGSDYTVVDKILHRLALGSPIVRECSFDLDGLLPDNAQNESDAKHVFISGLARAGTTILMRAFYETGQFRSLNYRDMPFVLMPGIWKKLSEAFRRHGEARERAHGDGIYVDFDSPEAFEEVFWRTFSGNNYIFDDCIRPHSVDRELIDKFRLYVRRIVASASEPGQRRYLSKNNNNILRLGAIRKAFPSALIIIPFRDPAQQAISLLSQHRRFCDRHSIDTFSRDYMRWVCHHEFGATHKPFRFDSEPEKSSAEYTPGDVNYWLSTWINAYRYLLNSVAPLGSSFMCFEDLCVSPAETLGDLFEEAELSFEEARINQVFHAPPAKEVAGIDDDLRAQAQRIYDDLRAFALKDVLS